MGSGFLSLPYAFARGGLALAPVVVALIGGMMMLACSWEAEAMARAEALEVRALRRGGATVPSPARLPTTGSKAPAISNRTFEVCELCGIFGGPILEAGYSIVFLVYYGATLWAYAFVFAESTSTFAPLAGAGACEHDVACPLYRWCMLFFGIIAVPLSVLEPGEQAEFQVFMSGLRVIVVLTMSFTAAAAALGADFGPEFAPTRPPPPLVRLAGLGRLLPASIFAQNLSGSVPLVSRELADRDQLVQVIAWGIFGPSVAYVLLGAVVAATFGGDVARSANVQWEGFCYGQHTDAWAAPVRYLIVLFPALDVLSIYPLNVAVAANTIMSLAAGDRADKLQRRTTTRRLVRFAFAIPPILGAALVSDFSKIIAVAGSLVFFISCAFPPLLSVLGKRLCRRKFGDERLDTTPFTLDGGRLWPKGVVLVGGATAAGVVLASSL